MKVGINDIMHDFWFYHAKWGNVRVENFVGDYGDEPWVYVYSEAIRHKDGYEFGYVSVGLDVLVPIPLTREVLEANGFLYNDEDSKFQPMTWSGLGIILESEGEAFRVVVVSDYDDEGTNCTPFVIRYVHELQMLLRLRGIEAEIKI